jgi:toxin-antitoxin system PIN domain toxin
MQLADANLLLFAYNSSAPEHAAAREWFEAGLSAPAPFALSWWTIGSFLRLTTNRAVFPQPLSPDEATHAVAAWLARPNVIVLEPGPRYWSIARGLIERSNARGPLIPDALLAALAIEHGATLATHDLDFRRFDGLDLIDPIAS